MIAEAPLAALLPKEGPLDPDAADAENRRRAMRWLVVAGVIFVVLMAWVILARVGR